MNRLTTLLTAFLALQLMLSAALFWPRENRGEQDARAPLLTLTGDVDRVIISDEDSTVLLTRGDDGWRMPEYHGLPVEAARIERAVAQLPGLPRGWPVADTANAAERFEVAEQAFQRRVEYFQGDDPAGTLYIGTSPGFRKVHARIADSDAIYAVDYNSFDLPAEASDWLDKRLLQLDDVTAVTGLDYTLSREGDDWRGEGDTAPDTETVDELVNALAGLRVTGAADIATAAILEEMDAPPTLTVQAGDQQFEYRLYEMEDERFIHRSDIAVYFALSGMDYDRLNEVSAASLYPVAESDPDDVQDTAAEPVDTAESNEDSGDAG
jgi:hypothetical protein